MPSTLSLTDRLRGKRTSDIALPTETDEGHERDYQREMKSGNPLTRMRATMKRGKRQIKRASNRGR